MGDALTKVLYAAEAVTEGGRTGHGRTFDGHVVAELSVPEAMGGQRGHGTSPEQLFALGYAACFQSALLAVAEGHGLDASHSEMGNNIQVTLTVDGTLVARSAA
jgi:osmotically inducible protein OsmC